MGSEALTDATGGQRQDVQVQWQQSSFPQAERDQHQAVQDDGDEN